jgi:predicted lipid carrier protein YhbT
MLANCTPKLEFTTTVEANVVTHLHQRYFTEYMPTIVGKQMIEDTDDFCGCVEIVASDIDELPWRFGIENGRLVYVGHEGPTPSCRFASDADTIVELITGRTSPTNAFMDMKIEVTGDLDMALQLSLLMEEFFQRFPYVPEQ